MFQVWRSTGIEGCYELVGYNTPLDGYVGVVPNSVIIIGAEGFLSPPGDSSHPLDHCVVLPVRESQQIEFQPDVIGYYVDYFRFEEDRDNGGIQWIDDDEVVVHYRNNLPREDIKSQYAIGIFNINPSVCGFLTENSNSYSLSDVATSAPIISISIGK